MRFSKGKQTVELFGKSGSSYIIFYIACSYVYGVSEISMEQGSSIYYYRDGLTCVHMLWDISCEQIINFMWP